MSKSPGVTPVVPANAGTQEHGPLDGPGVMGPRFRGDDSAMNSCPLRFSSFASLLIFLLGLFILSRFSFFPFAAPMRGGRSADRRPDAASASGGVHDRTRALTFEARARHFQLRKCPPLGAPSWRFSDVPALYYRCSLDPAAMAALGGQDSRDAGLPSVGAVANRSGDATPCSAFPVRLSRRLPLMSKADALCSICSLRSQRY
jgi:hypothetical protein